MFYQKVHSMDSDYFMFEQKEDFSFPLHIHSCFEIIVVLDGELHVTVGNNSAVLKRNDVALVFPNQIHGMKSECQSLHKLCVFSKKLINFFNIKTQNLIPRSPFFHIEDDVRKLFEQIEDSADICTVKGLLYILCGIFGKNAEYQEINGQNSDALLYRMLEYVEKNFMGECTLKELAQEFNYDYAYLSKYFIRNVEMPFKEYVNRRKISEASHLLLTTDQSILEIAYHSGYQSLRSFNRNFKQLTGFTPSEYREL